MGGGGRHRAGRVLAVLLAACSAVLALSPSRVLALRSTAQPVAASTTARLDLLIRGEDNALWDNYSDSTGWHSWQSLGGLLSSAPAAVASDSNRTDVFVRGTDNQLYHNWWNGTAWNGYELLGGQLSSGPGAASWAPGRLDVFVRGTDNALWHQSWSSGAWSGWGQLGGILTSDPTAIAWAPNRLDVFVRGGDNALWHRWWDGTRWGGWESLGGVLASNPTAVAWAPNRLDVLVRGADNALYHRWWDGTRWGGWESLGGVLSSDPAPVAWSANRLDVFVRGGDNALWHRWWDGTRWGGWESLGGVLASDPSADSRAAGQLDVFVRGTDAAIWQRNYTQGWSLWSSLGGRASWDSSPATWNSTSAQPPHALSRTATMDENVMYDVPYYQQLYELSCEEASLQMALAHEGKSVTQAQELNDLGIDPRAGYYDVNGVLHWGDAQALFVGDPNGSEVALTGYGTYSAPIARIAGGYGAHVLAAGQGIAPSAVYSAVLQNHPVVAWVSFDWSYHSPGRYLAFDGNWLVWSGPSEHAVTVVGVTAGSVLVNNPWSGPEWVSKSTFQAAYASYRDMAVELS